MLLALLRQERLFHAICFDSLPLSDGVLLDHFAEVSVLPIFLLRKSKNQFRVLPEEGKQGL
jgi:hypothetical protein